jgi:hypothetical protein
MEKYLITNGWILLLPDCMTIGARQKLKGSVAWYYTACCPMFWLEREIMQNSENLKGTRKVILKNL